MYLPIYLAVHPPSMANSEPVMLVAAGPHKNTTISPMSSEVVKRRVGSLADSNSSVAASIEMPFLLAIVSICFCTRSV